MTDLGIGQTFFSGYRTVDQVLQDLRTLDASSPLATLVDYGDSYAKTVGGLTLPDGSRCLGYDLLALKITRGAAAKPPLVVVAGMHSRELLQAEIALRFAQHLVFNYGADSAVQSVVDSRDIYIIPTCNPDGLFTVARGGNSPNFQRKNIDPSNGTGDWPPGLNNHTGIDLNRNFNFKWDASVTAGFTSTVASSEFYKGPSAASEPEATALQTFLTSILEDQRGTGDEDAAPADTEGLVLDLHQNAGTGNECCFPWSWTTTNCPNHAELSALATRLAAHISFDVGQLADHLGYTLSGGFIDWVYGTFGVPALLFEDGLFTGGAPFLTVYNDVITKWPTRCKMLMDAASVAATPYSL